MFAEVLVMHLVCPANSTDIGIIAAGKPFEPLVDDDIMDKEIGKAVSHDAKANSMKPPHTRSLHAKHDTQETGYGKNDKESIIFFEKTRFNFVVIFVQIPQESMHHPPVCTPGYTFHQQKNAENDTYIVNHNHNLKLMLCSFL
jgi:hypothetical protein